MDYLGDLAAAQQQLARCLDLVARRVVVLEALDAGPGDNVVEVGCGAGLCLREIGVAVGATGSVLGIELSAEQATAAREHCRDLANVRIEQGNLTAMPIDDAKVDAAVSVQVLEYVPAVEAALAEIGRVTRPGGRFVNVATNWGSLFWSGGDPNLTRQVLSVWEHHAPHPNLPVALPSLLRGHGYGGVTQRPVTILNRRFCPNSFSWGAARLMAAFARSRGALTAAELDQWLASLADADATGAHFLSSVPVLTVATRAGT